VPNLQYIVNPDNLPALFGLPTKNYNH